MTHPLARRALLAAAALAPVAAPPVARAQAPRVRVENAWSRPTLPDAPAGVVYMTLTAPADDRLTGITTPVARQAELHRSQETGGVMRMRAVPGGLALPAGKPVAIAPGGYHVMLLGLTTQLKPGQQIPLRLTFARSGPVDVEATVRPFGGTAAPMPAMHMP